MVGALYIYVCVCVCVCMFTFKALVGGAGRGGWVSTTVEGKDSTMA